VPPLKEADYNALRENIRAKGVLVPLDVTAAGVVLDGHHRLRAARELGLETVPVRLVKPADELLYLLEMALLRRQLEKGPRAALAVELANVQGLRAEARERQRANLRNQPEVARLPPRGKTREVLAPLAQVSPRLMHDVLLLHEQDPVLFQRVKAGELAPDTAARRVRRARRDAQLTSAPPLPQGPFDLLYADPPWQLGNPDGPWAPENHYSTLPQEQIAAMSIPAAERAVLFLWGVNGELGQALEVMASWGFTYKANIVWVKPSIGLGRWVRNRHELLLVGCKGGYPPPDPEDLPDSVVEGPRGRHSQKPDRFCELIEQMYPLASKLELFARGKPRPGWAAWGNEVEEQ
jgi:N6-adenosine-specific RNA methylase IME4